MIHGTVTSADLRRLDDWTATAQLAAQARAAGLSGRQTADAIGPPRPTASPRRPEVAREGYELLDAVYAAMPDHPSAVRDLLAWVWRRKSYGDTAAANPRLRIVMRSLRKVCPRSWRRSLTASYRLAARPDSDALLRRWEADRGYRTR